MSNSTETSNAKELKLALLFYGLALNEATLSRLQTLETKFGHGLFDYSGNHSPRQIPQEIWLDEDTVVRVHRQPESPYELTFDRDILIVKDRRRNTHPVRLSPRPRFYNLQLPNRTLGEQHCQINGADRLNVYAFNFCAFTHQNVACSFCNVSHSGPDLQTSIRKQLDQVASVVSAAREEQAFAHFCFSGGAFPDANKGAQTYIDLCNAIRKQTGSTTLEGDVSLVPPRDLTYIDLLAETGIRTLSMNLEVLDEQLFAAICPGKNQIRLTHYRSAFERAVKSFGFGRVRSNLVLGLEPLASFKRGTKRLAEMGVVPTTNVYWQSTAQYLRHAEAENIEYYRAAYHWLKELYCDNGFEPPWCARCTIASMDHEAGRVA